MPLFFDKSTQFSNYYYYLLWAKRYEKKGREVQQSMGIQTQILQKMKIEGNDAENMVNDMLSKLGDL